LTHYTKHIGFVLFLIFSSSLFIDAAVAAHNLYQFSSYDEYSIERVSQCEKDTISAEASAENIRIFKIITTDEKEDTEKTLTSSCSNSNLFLPSKTTLASSHFSRSFINFNPFLSSQLFVSKIADPPRQV